MLRNLLSDPFLRVIRRDGRSDGPFSIQDILGEGSPDNPIIDVMTPRPDFKNALYQLFIGILQVAFTPKDEEEWALYFKNPPSSDEINKAITPYLDCFNLTGEGPLFMQDFEDFTEKEKSIESLLIDGPSENALKKNTGLFNKPGQFEKIDLYWAAVALYTLQTFAPSGGVGHRVGVRGGGPLTQLLLSQGPEMSLWRNLWANIFSYDNLGLILGDLNKREKSDIFPYLKKTRTSEKDQALYQKECHPLHSFFATPRRMHLFYKEQEGICDLTGVASSCLVYAFKQKNYGHQYKDWIHPLSAYRRDPQKPSDPPLSIKGSPEGINYQHWSYVVFESPKIQVALVKKIFDDSEYRQHCLKEGVRIWIAGYDLDKAKVRCWYEATMPLFALNKEERETLYSLIQTWISAAVEVSKSIVYALKLAWFRDPKSDNVKKGDFSFITLQFFQDTEHFFFSLLSSIVREYCEESTRKKKSSEWFSLISKESFKLFELHALSQQEDGIDFERVVQAKHYLLGRIRFVKNNMNNLIEE